MWKSFTWNRNTEIYNDGGGDAFTHLFLELKTKLIYLEQLNRNLPKADINSNQTPTILTLFPKNKIKFHNTGLYPSKKNQYLNRLAPVGGPLQELKHAKETITKPTYIYYDDAIDVTLAVHGTVDQISHLLRLCKSYPNGHIS